MPYTQRECFALYTQALESYSAGRLHMAVEQVHQAVVDLEARPPSMVFYRLWIEVLIELEDSSGLGLLKDHLMILSVANQEAAEDWLALRALIHFALDERDAALLWLRSFHARNQSVYVYELRILMNPETKLKAHDWNLALGDYFCAQSVLLRQFQAQNRSLATMVDQLESVYPLSPLRSLLRMIQASEREDYALGMSEAEELSRRFPTRREYSLEKIFFLYRLGDYKEAAQQAEKALGIFGREDAELLSLKAVSIASQALSQQDSQAAAVASRHLANIIERKEKDGLSAQRERAMLQRVREEYPDSAPKRLSTGRRNWLFELSAAKYHELKTRPLSQVKFLLRAMGKEPRPGDLCFVVGPDPHHPTIPKVQKEWRLGAIYEVVSDAEYHPLKRWQSRLRLVIRLELSIPLPIVERDFKPKPLGQKSQPHRAQDYGLFRLDQDALNLIQTAVKEFEPTTDILSAVLG